MIRQFDYKRSITNRATWALTVLLTATAPLLAPKAYAEKLNCSEIFGATPTKFDLLTEKVSEDWDRANWLQYNDNAGGFSYIGFRAFYDGKTGKFIRTSGVEVDGFPFRRMPLKVSKEGQSRWVAWAPIKLMAEGFSIMEIARKVPPNAFLENKEGFGFSLLTGSLNPNVIHKIHLRTNHSDSIARSLGKDVWYEADLGKDKTRELDWSVIKFSDLRLVDETGALVREHKIQVEETITGVGLSAIAKNTSAPKIVDLDRTSTIEFENQLANVVDLTGFFKFGAIGVGAGSDRRHPDFYGVTDALANAALVKFVQSMRKPENQDYAVQVVRAGQEAMETELQKDGGPNHLRFSIKPYMRNGEMVEPALPDKASMIDVMQSLNQLRLPYESGPFGDIHGKWAHQAQFIAGFRDLTPQERTAVVYLFAYHFGPLEKFWPYWQFLVDSRGLSVFGNRHWRDKIDNPTK